MRYKLQLIVKPRQGVRDPQGEAVQEVLEQLGYQDLHVHCVGRYLHFDVAAASAKEAEDIAKSMCQRILVNPNLETYEMICEAKTSENDPCAY